MTRRHPSRARIRSRPALVPKSLQVLRAHLGDGDTVNPDAWRAALRVFEHAYGRAPEQVEPVVGLPEDALAIRAMSCREMQVLAMRFTEGLPEGDPAFVVIDGAADSEPPRTRG